MGSIVVPSVEVSIDFDMLPYYSQIGDLDTAEIYEKVIKYLTADGLPKAKWSLELGEETYLTGQASAASQEKAEDVANQFAAVFGATEPEWWPRGKSFIVSAADDGLEIYVYVKVSGRGGKS